MMPSPDTPDADSILAAATSPSAPAVILSFDVEEHFRIEAAVGLSVPPGFREHCAGRVDTASRWLLDLLAAHDQRATFFIVGQVGARNPDLVRAIARAGHEVASHSWDHRRVHHFTPATFRTDVRQSKDALEQITGQPVVGYRAPTFSIVRETGWALDILAELGMAYDSSIYPVRHDRYGISNAPRSPFLARGCEHTLLELPPVTLRGLGLNAPMGGGGYFRLFPLWVTQWAIQQTLRRTVPPVAMLYFHPWEFDTEQECLPLGWFNRFRTYVGINRTEGRLRTLLGQYRAQRAVDVARSLARKQLPVFEVGEPLPSLIATPARGIDLSPSIADGVNHG